MTFLMYKNGQSLTRSGRGMESTFYQFDRYQDGKLVFKDEDNWKHEVNAHYFLDSINDWRGEYKLEGKESVEKVTEYIKSMIP